jgi:hypothetical protein
MRLSTAPAPIDVDPLGDVRFGEAATGELMTSAGAKPSGGEIETETSPRRGPSAGRDPAPDQHRRREVFERGADRFEQGDFVRAGPPRSASA